MGDETEKDEERDSGEETECCGEAGAAAVGPVAYEGGEKGREDEGEEDEAGAGGGETECARGVEGEGGVPGCQEGGLREGAVESGEEAAGGEKERYRVFAFFGGVDGWYF